MTAKEINYIAKAAESWESWADALKIALTEKQKAVLGEVAGPDKGSHHLNLDHAEGKTFLTAFEATRWCMSRPHSRVLLVCPTLIQSKHIWIPEAKRMVERNPILSSAYTFTQSGFRMFGEQGYDWGCVVGTSNYQSLQGYCSNHLLVIAEEHRNMSSDARACISGYSLGGKVIYTGR